VKYLQALLSRPGGASRAAELLAESPTKPPEPPSGEVLSALSVSPDGFGTTAGMRDASAAARQLNEALPFLWMPLDVFAREGASLAVRVPWLEVTLWMVPTDQDAAALVGEGVNRGRIWTSTELMNLMSIADRTLDMVKRLALAKFELGGEVVEVRRR